LSRRERELRASEPDAQEAAKKAADADDAYLSKTRARNQQLRTARSQAEKSAASIAKELEELPLRLEDAAREVGEIVGKATTRSSVDWIQAKALAEVLAPELGDAIRQVEQDLESLRGAAATPGREIGARLTRADESFASMLATARRKVEDLLV